MHATRTSKGQFTIPGPIRDRLRLQPGGKIDFVLQEHGNLRIMPVTAFVTRPRSMVSKPTVPATLAEMAAAVARRAARKR